MKRMVFALATILMFAVSAKAQRLEHAKDEASYITRIMTTELGLTRVQSQELLRINLVYLDGISSYRDIEGRGCKSRDKKIKSLLSKRQWRQYKNTYYFYRPISWRDHAYVHHIYAKYPKNKKHKYCKHQVDRNWRQQGNNSPEAIRQRQKMRRHVMNGAR